LRANQISVLGASETAAYAPHIFTTRAGSKAAIIGLDDADDTADETLIATAGNRERVAAAITEARSQAAFVLVFMHWGEENTERVGDRQRELARWVIEHGADAVAGSHPHCVQPFDAYHGRPIFYSLGNLVFDGAPTLPGWNRGTLLEVDLGGIRPSFTSVPVQLDARGFPQLAATDESPWREIADGGSSAPRSVTNYPGAAVK
jgi:poly-gamma-glutamate synthesis protein (capsule biosynthesis protein)